MPSKSRSLSPATKKRHREHMEEFRALPNVIEDRNWGNVVYNAELRKRARETNSQRRSRERKEQEEEDEFRARAHLQSKRSRFLNAQGKLTARIYSACKKALYPAGDGFPAGCAAHAIHECPWFHPGEPEYDAVCAGTLRGPVKEGREFEKAKREIQEAKSQAAAKVKSKGKTRANNGRGKKLGKDTRKNARAMYRN